MLIVDRIAGTFAVCEEADRRMVVLPLELLPDGVREGDCLRETEAGYVFDREEEARRRRFNADLFRSLLASDDE